MKLIKYINVSQESSKVFREFSQWSKLINLDSKWSLENAFEIEIKKSILRSKIRYSSITDKLIVKILNNIKNITNGDCKVTRFYPMIHLPYDKLEAGGYHFDQVENKNIKTIWVAASNYKYPALSIFDLGFNNRKINSLLIKSKIPNLLSKKVYSEQGDVNIWDGKLIHAGNFNNSEATALALQMKIINIDEEFIFEETNNIKNINGTCFSNSEEINTDIVKLNYEFQEIIKEIQELNKSNNKIENNLMQLNNYFKKYNKYNFKYYSFALSILSQRIRSFRKFFNNISNLNNFVSMLDYISIMLGAENLISVKRLYFDNDKKEEFIYLIKNYIQDSDDKFHKFKKIIKIF